MAANPGQLHVEMLTSPYWESETIKPVEIFQFDLSAAGEGEKLLLSLVS